MNYQHTNHLSSLKIHRLCLLMTLSIYPVWGLFAIEFYLPTAIGDGLISRMLGTSIAYIGIILLSFKKFQKYSEDFVIASNFLLLTHYIYLCYANDFNPVYSNGIYIAIVALIAFFEKITPLVIYCFYIFTCSLSIFLIEKPLIHPSYFLLGVFTVCMGAGFTTFLRIRADQKSMSALAEKKKQENMTRMVAGIAHEFNTPLGIVLGVNNFIKKEFGEENPRALKRIESSNRAINKMAEIVSDLHTVVFGSYSRRLEKKNISQVVDEAVELFHKKNPTLNFYPIINSQDFDTYVLVEALTIPRAICSVLENSYLATKELEQKAYVEISFDKASNSLLVVNNGEKITSQKSQIIFEPFYTEREPGCGVGLGLTTAKSAMESIDGELKYLNNKDKTTFSFSFKKTS